jgi:hypothetical protein
VNKARDGYWAFLSGNEVVYFGRKGEFHVEEFPRAKSQSISGMARGPDSND